ncbi:MAG: bifunctional phosphopantothenoylcysteine decarboxylase/phosphopantothenate--cysteine ligase CoaBC [Chloroflexi bacterium]|nr:bifunctional phosphopantothenoylcysteine decarboxylase/phosphopantothenate--cysteine ligase CoaBC [Chloroflexota bacterium]
MLKDKKLILGVTGSIAAYKAVDLASKLTQAGAEVNVIMTRSAQEFVTLLSFRAITGRPVITDMFDISSEFAVEHVALARRAQGVVIAPATANILAKLAQGLADDMLTVTVLATQAPVLVAPAMDAAMFQAAATQENLAKLKERGFTMVGPGYGRLASGEMGLGRLVDAQEIMDALKQVLGRGGDLAGRKVVVSAGGTQEPIDPVRVITNRSSGKMGYALAEAARDRGAQVALVTAATLPDPFGVETRHVQTVAQMREAILSACQGADAVIMAAAVSDFRPAEVAKQKVKKSPGREALTLKLKKIQDFFPEVPKGVLRVGFAAETENLVANARKKLREKGLDLIVANDVAASDSGFATDTNRAVLMDCRGKEEALPLMLKSELAERILNKIVELLKERGAGN